MRAEEKEQEKGKERINVEYPLKRQYLFSEACITCPINTKAESAPPLC